MSERKRTSVEDAIGSVLGMLEDDTPMSIGEIASETGLSWVVVNRAIDLVVKIQDYFRANRIEALGGKGKKFIIVELRVDLTKLPERVREWFIEEKFFKGEEKKQYTTEEARDILYTRRKQTTRTRLEDAIDCVLDALELEDELSVLELSKRTGLNRRTIERVLEIFARFQDRLAGQYIIRLEGNIVLRKHPGFYTLDETRMRYLLKKLYLPNLADELSEERERALFQMA
jgi:DNA-binding transcriptional regulator GbsR (MarR family)